MSHHESSIPTNADLQALRELLFKQESLRIDKLEKVLGNQELHAQEIAKILAEAVQIRSRNDNKLGQALAPAVEEALKISIARNPQPLSDALFPVMGPAIRKAIQSAIATMLQSMNQTLEHAFTVQGLRWRLDAARTGKSFAEIVLLNTLVYRVEQVFLIHKETGLLLKHIALDPAHHEDADVVSGMLTAVQDFIRDSFSGNENQSIESLRMGDLQVLIEQGPDVILAVVCRGNPPQSLHDNMQSNIEIIQHEFHKELQDFDGDNQTFATVDLALSPLLVADYQTQAKQSSPIKPIVILAIIATCITTWVIWNYRQQAAIDTQWETYTQQLMDEPGIVITAHSTKNEKHIIQGLRDPLSHDPYKLLKTFNLSPTQLHLNLQPYQSLAPTFVLKRVSSILQPPQGILLSMQGSTLILTGSASQNWLNKAQKKAGFIAGITRIDTSKVSSEPTLLERIKTLLQPTPNIHLSLHEHTLTASGKATQAWAKQAETNIQGISEITQYQSQKLQLIDSSSYILKQAYAALNPPKSVRLSINKNQKLIAQGTATDTWKKRAQRKAKHIAHVKAYDDHKVFFTHDNILQHAISALLPPKTVQLSLSNKILIAAGEAKQTWVDTANNEAGNLEGIDGFDNQVSIWVDNDAILAAAIKQLQPPPSVTLHFQGGVLHAVGKATGAWISRVQEQFILIDGVHSFYTNNLKNTTKTWSSIQQKINHFTITFPSSIAKLSPSMKDQLKDVAMLFKDAQAIEPDSQLFIKAPYNNAEVFITSLRLKATLKSLQAHGISNKYLKSISHKTDAKNISKKIHFSLKSITTKP